MRTLIIAAALLACAAHAQDKGAKMSADANRGRYLVATAGCNARLEDDRKPVDGVVTGSFPL